MFSILKIIGQEIINLQYCSKTSYLKFWSFESPKYFKLHPKSRQKIYCIAPKIVGLFQVSKIQKFEHEYQSWADNFLNLIVLSKHKCFLNTSISPEHQITSLTWLFYPNTRASHLSVGFHTLPCKEFDRSAVRCYFYKPWQMHIIYLCICNLSLIKKSSDLIMRNEWAEYNNE